MSAAPARASYRLTVLSRLQARCARRLLLFLGTVVFRLKFEFQGLEHLPRGEPLLIAGAPHRNWIDPFLIVMALPTVPRIYFLGSAEGMFNKWWKRAVIRLLGGVVPVSTQGHLNRQGLETALAILGDGNHLGIFPEGWDQETKPPAEVQPVQRGVGFLAAHSGRRVLPFGLAGTQELWRGKTLRLRLGPPLPALDGGASRVDEVAYLGRLREALIGVLPPLPPEPVDGSKPWPWLTRLLY